MDPFSNVVVSISILGVSVIIGIVILVCIWDWICKVNKYMKDHP